MVADVVLRVEGRVVLAAAVQQVEHRVAARGVVAVGQQYVDARQPADRRRGQLVVLHTTVVLVLGHREGFLGRGRSGDDGAAPNHGGGGEPTHPLSRVRRLSRWAQAPLGRRPDGESAGEVRALKGMACPWWSTMTAVAGRTYRPGVRSADGHRPAFVTGPHGAPPSAPTYETRFTPYANRIVNTIPCRDHPEDLRRRAGRAGCARTARRPFGRTCRWFRSSGRRSGRQYDLRPPATMASVDRRHSSSQHDTHTNPERRRTDSIQQNHHQRYNCRIRA